MASPEREYWIAGGRDELKSLKDLKVFALIPRSEVSAGQRPLKGKLVCKRKRDEDGNVIRYKVQFVAKGFAQRYGADYGKTNAPTARLESLRQILHIAASLNRDTHQFDNIKTTFLHGVLPEDETMYLEQPPGFEEEGKEDWVGIITGNPGVFQGYPYPYPPKTHTRAEGTGIPRLGLRVPVGQTDQKTRAGYPWET